MGCCGQTPPPLRTQVRSAIKAAGRVVKAVIEGEQVLVSDAVFAQRISICSACEFVIPPLPGSDYLRCADCGCGLNGKVKFKAKLATEPCRFWPQTPDPIRQTPKEGA